MNEETKQELIANIKNRPLLHNSILLQPLQHMKFGERLKALRQLAGISGKDMSNLVGVTYAAYMGYENKDNQPKFEILLKIADIFGVSTDFLLGASANPARNNDNSINTPFNDTNTTASSDIEPLIQEIKKILFCNETANYHGEIISTAARVAISRELGLIEAFALIPAKEIKDVHSFITSDLISILQNKNIEAESVSNGIMKLNYDFYLNLCKEKGIQPKTYDEYAKIIFDKKYLNEK